VIAIVKQTEATRTSHFALILHRQTTSLTPKVTYVNSLVHFVTPTFFLATFLFYSLFYLLMPLLIPFNQ